MSRTRGPHEAQLTAIRRQHIGACITRLRDFGPASLTDLARATGLSRPTLDSIVATLGEKGLVVEGPSSTESRRAGRPARRFTFDPSARYVIGLDAGAHSLDAALCDLGGTVATQLRISIDPSTPAAMRIRQVHEAMDQLLAKAHLSTYRVHCAVVAAPGIIDRHGRVILCEAIEDFANLNLAAALGESVPFPVIVENDVNMAALAEHRIGAAQLASDLLYFHVGHRGAAALILDGEVHRGRHDSAGEIADMTSIMWRDDPGDGSVARRIATAARAGDPDAIARLDAFAQDVSRPLGTLATALDPDLIVIGGGLSRAGDVLIDALARAVTARAAGRPLPPIVASALGDDAVALGSLIRGLQHVNKHLFRAEQLPTPTINHRKATPVSVTSPDSLSVPAHPEGHVADPRTLQVAVVGVGARAKLAQWLQEPQSGARLVAAADPHPLALARSRQLFGDIPLVQTHQELLDFGVEAAIVTSPDDTHVEIAVDLLRAGIAVYLEKPIATTIEDADLILATARETGTKVYVGHNMRHMAVVKLMRQIIQRGEIGEVKAIWCRHFVGNGGDYYFKDWHAEREHTTSLLLQKGAHDIDVMHWLAGSVSRDVVGMGDLMIYGDIDDRADHSTEVMTDWFSYKNWPPLSQRELNPVIDVEDLSMVMMRLESGVLASYEQCHFTPDYWRNYTVIGTEGRLENFGDGDGGEVRVWNHRTEFEEKGHVTYPIEGDAYGHNDADALTVAEFVEFVKNGTPTETSPVSARDAVATGVMATESLRDGSTPRRVPRLSADLAAYYAHDQQADRR